MHLFMDFQVAQMKFCKHLLNNVINLWNFNQANWKNESSQQKSLAMNFFKVQYIKM